MVDSSTSAAIIADCLVEAEIAIVDNQGIVGFNCSATYDGNTNKVNLLLDNTHNG